MSNIFNVSTSSVYHKDKAGEKDGQRMLDKMGVKYELIDITKNPEILQKYPIMAAPGVVINGKLEFVGVPKEQELAKKVRT